MSCGKMEGMKKAVLLILPVLFLAGCTVKNKEMEITVFHTPMSAVYTGKVKRKLADGEGSARLENEAGVEGIFEKGTWISGEAEAVPYRVSYGDQTYSGSYTGSVSEEMPEGTGEFRSESFSYNGTWTNGAVDGTGTVSTPSFQMDTAEEVITGSYSGTIREGLAEGTGTFVYRDGEDEIQMEGSFVGNQYDGKLIRTIRTRGSERSYPVYYSKGSLLHTPASMIGYMEGMRQKSYCLNDDQLSFIENHEAMFDGSETVGKQSDEYDKAFAFGSFMDGSDPSLILIPDCLIQSIQRYKLREDTDPVTSMIVQNGDEWYHLVFAYSVDSAEQGDTVDVAAMPLCRTVLTAPEQDYPAIDAAGCAVIKK